MCAKSRCCLPSSNHKPSDKCQHRVTKIPGISAVSEDLLDTARMPPLLPGCLMQDRLLCFAALLAKEREKEKKKAEQWKLQVEKEAKKERKKQEELQKAEEKAASKLRKEEEQKQLALDKEAEKRQQRAAAEKLVSISFQQVLVLQAVMDKVYCSI